MHRHCRADRHAVPQRDHVGTHLRGRPLPRLAPRRPRDAGARRKIAAGGARVEYSLSPDLWPLAAFAFLAGFIDSVAGGGGLIQVPALFVFLPTVPAATLLGTNKFASIWGTSVATLQYARAVPLEWRATLPTCV